jgi:hypothetical protein
MPYRLLRSASPITGNSFDSHRRMDSWLIVNPRNSMIKAGSAAAKFLALPPIPCAAHQPRYRLTDDGRKIAPLTQ